MRMGRMKEYAMDRQIFLGDVFDAGNQLDEGLYTGDDVRSDEFMEESLNRFEDMLRDVEPQVIRAYGMPWPAHGRVVAQLDRR